MRTATLVLTAVLAWTIAIGGLFWVALQNEARAASAVVSSITVGCNADGTLAIKSNPTK